MHALTKHAIMMFTGLGVGQGYGSGWSISAGYLR